MTAEDAVQSALRAAARRVLEYGESHHQHVPLWFYDPELKETVEKCNWEGGDRCDITAAYRYAAQLITNTKRDEQLQALADTQTLGDEG